MFNPRALVSLAALTVAGTTGCTSNVLFSDTVDLHLNFNPLQGPTDGLHLPYVAGADMGIWVQSRIGGKDVSGWRLVSMNDDVLQITGEVRVETDSDNADAVFVSAIATGHGLVELVAVDEAGRELGAATIDVRTPDQVQLLANGPLILDRPELMGWGENQAVVGGMSTWLARYFDGDTQLHGHGTLEVLGDPTMALYEETTFLFEDRDWLQVVPHEPGVRPIDLHVNGEFVQSVDFEVVTQEDVAGIEIHGMNESLATPGEQLVLLAQGVDSDAQPIYGLEFQWDLDGEGEGLGDLYRYAFEPERESTATATLGEHVVSAAVHGEGYVDSTNNLGCSTAPGSRAPLGVLALMSATLVARRR